MMQSVDIAIVGGGMVGLALAAAFKDSELRIAVIESRNLMKNSMNYPMFEFLL